MPAPTTPTNALRFHLSVWRIAVWLLLFLAAFGILQYSREAWHAVTALRGGDVASDAAHAHLTSLLAWNGIYLAGACVTLAAAAGALLRRTWARPVLRVVCALLALWLLVAVVMLIVHWIGFNHDAHALLAQSGVASTGQALVARVQHAYLVQAVLKAVCVLVLAWLTWRLGAPSVRAQFRRSAAQPGTRIQH